MNKYVAEFIGTFFLVLTIGCTVIGAPAGIIPPLAIGTTLMVMIFAGGHISGAHYNPAVTLAVLIRGKVTAQDGIAYMVVQIIAAIVAALIAKWYMGDMGVATMDLTGKVLKVFIGELIGTFALAYVVLNVATSKGTTGNSFYGLAISFTVFAMATAFGAVSGGAFNPAVAIGATVVGAFALKNIWIYLIACFGGGFLAALV